MADTLTFSPRRGTTRSALAPNAVAGAVLALTLGAVVVTSVGGVFKLTMPAAAQALAPTTAGTVDVEQIRGSMSFAEISSATGIPPMVFEQQFGVQPAEMNTPIKDLAPVYGFDVHTDVREFVKMQLESGAAVPPTAGSAGAAAGAAED